MDFFLLVNPFSYICLTLKSKSKWSSFSFFFCTGIFHYSARAFFCTATQLTKCLWWTNTGKSFSTFSRGYGKGVHTSPLVPTLSCTACIMLIPIHLKTRIAHTTPKICFRWCGRPKIFTTTISALSWGQKSVFQKIFLTGTNLIALQIACWLD